MSSTLKILIVEDEMVIAMDLSDKLEEMGYEVIDSAASFEEALQSIEQNTPDIIILDIQLEGEKTGIDLGKHLNEHHDVPFIYLTSNSDKRTLNEAKDSQPFAFLKKPFQEDDLFNAIELAVHNFQNQKKSTVGSRPKSIVRDSIFVKHKGHFEKIALSEIVILKADHVYVEIVTVNDQKRLVRDSLSEFMDSLPKHFVRVHRSYGVNLDHIKKVNNSEVIMSNKETVPVSKSQRSELMQLLGIE